MTAKRKIRMGGICARSLNLRAMSGLPIKRADNHTLVEETVPDTLVAHATAIVNRPRGASKTTEHRARVAQAQAKLAETEVTP